MYVASWNETHYWRFEPGGCAELGLSEGCDPPTLFLARSAGSEDWITLMPPRVASEVHPEWWTGAYEGFRQPLGVTARSCRD
jgi:hypothetical protein